MNDMSPKQVRLVVLIVLMAVGLSIYPVSQESAFPFVNEMLSASLPVHPQKYDCKVVQDGDQLYLDCDQFKIHLASPKVYGFVTPTPLPPNV